MTKVYAVVHYSMHKDFIYDIDDVFLIEKNTDNFIHYRYHPQYDSITWKGIDGFNNMYKHVLNMLKANNHYCGCDIQFGAKFYDILWVNSKLPSDGDRYGYYEE